MESNIILSICISTFNRAEKIEKLVTEILKCKSDKLSVVVVDDNSTDDTIMRLKRLADTRLSIVKNETNLGARTNWFETIDKGNGKYILHLLDRDWLDYRYLDKLIGVLDGSDAGFGYVGNFFIRSWQLSKKRETVEYYKQGIDAIYTFAFNWAHPSGFFVRRDEWDSVKDRNIFYDKRHGIYPHAYIYALLADKVPGMVIKYKMINITSKANFVRNKSRFYEHEKSKMLYWWTPESWKNEICLATAFACERALWDKEQIREVLKRRFQDALYFATISYRKSALNPENSMHYNINREYVVESDLLKINIRFLLHYFKFIRDQKFNILNGQFIADLLQVNGSNLNEILKQG